MGFYSASEPVSEPSFWFENNLKVTLIPAALLDHQEKQKIGTPTLGKLPEVVLTEVERLAAEKGTQ